MVMAHVVPEVLYGRSPWPLYCRICHFEVEGRLCTHVWPISGEEPHPGDLRGGAKANESSLGGLEYSTAMLEGDAHQLCHTDVLCLPFSMSKSGAGRVSRVISNVISEMLSLGGVKSTT